MTNTFVAAHRKVIAYIHLGFRDKPFAIAEITKGCGASESSVTRTLRKLVDLRLVRHTPNRFAGRNYEISRVWDKDVMKVIENYELAKIIGI